MMNRASHPLQIGNLLLDRKTVLLAGYLALDWRAIVGRVASLGISLELGFYIALFAILTTGLLAAAYIPARWPRLAVAVLCGAASVTLHGYEWTTASPLTYSAFETMLASRGDAGDALAQHAFDMARAVGAAALLFAAISLPPRSKNLPLGLHWMLPLFAFVLLLSILYVRGGEGSRALPAPYTPLAHAAIKLGLHIAVHDGPRRPVTLAPDGNATAGDIVLIVDESIAPTYLDINHPAGAYSGLAQEVDGLQIANFGIAAALTNCSAGSNKSMRFGGTRANFRDKAQRGPSVWAYASKAGYRTVYLDGQRMNGVLQNLADEAERAEIDDFVQLGGDVAVVDRDHALARLLSERLANDIREFIYVNKVGAHFPVADKFPLHAARYLPIPERGLYRTIIDMGPVHGSHRGTAAEWRLYRNAYRNTLEWNTGGFFDHLLPRAADSGAVMIYTADHGQDLHERGNPGKGTHCTNAPQPEEGAVPMVVIDQAGMGRHDWLASARAVKDGASQSRIFPTLLALMGYGAHDTRTGYGPSLQEPVRERLAFTTDWFAMLGKEPTWRPIDPGSLAVPDPADHLPLAD